MYYVVKFFVRLYFRIMYNVHAEGRENIPKGKPVIYASNHRSYADPPLVGSFAKGRLCFMAKEELFKNPVFAWLIRSLGAFPVARGKGDTGTIDKAVENLKSRSMMIFPEGTRSKDGKVHRGHSGAALIAVRANVPIIPVGVCYGEKLKFRTKLRVVYGKPIDPAEYCTISDEPNPRELVKLKNRYMADIKYIVEGEPEESKENENE